MDDTQKLHSNQNKKFCPKCGAESDINSKFCPKCGKDFGGGPVNSQAEQQSIPYGDQRQAPYGNMNQPGRDDNRGLGTGAVIAIIISGMIAAALLIFIVYNMVIKDRNIKSSMDNMNTKIEETKKDSELQRLKDEVKNAEEAERRAKELEQQRQVDEKEREIRELKEKLERKPATTPAPAPAPAPSPTATDSSYILPYSNSVYLSWDELDLLTRSDIEYARNEIYARRGYVFKEQRFKNYFNNKTWYVPNSGFHEGMFNSVEKANIEAIVSYEKTMGWR